MRRSPVQAFADLKGAMTRMIMLNNYMSVDQNGEGSGLVTLRDAQADIAMQAFADLVLQEEALGDIEQLLEATYGGVAE